MEKQSGTRRYNGIPWLLLIGGIILSWSLVMAAIGAPWRMLLYDEAEGRPLPDPSPLPVTAQMAGAQPQQTGVKLFNTFPLIRPQMDLNRLGSIKLPKIGISENVVEGTGDEMLYAVGHVPGTAMPGETGNCVLAAHRNYIRMRPFRHLNLLESGDEVQITYEGTIYTYQFYQSLVVEPHEVWVMESQEREARLLTLITCTPVWSQTHRLILWCRLIETAPAPSSAIQLQ